MRKQRLIINTVLVLLISTIIYTTVFPGKEPISKDIIERFFPDANLNKLFKVKDDSSKKYFFIKNKKTVEVYKLDDTSNKMNKEKSIVYKSYWFTVRNQGYDTYLVLFDDIKKREIKLFDSDIELISKELELLKIN